jgi:hypothetical protein
MWILIADPRDGADGEKNMWLKLGPAPSEAQRNDSWYNQEGIDLHTLYGAYVDENLDAELIYRQRLGLGPPNEDQMAVLTNRIARRSQWEILKALKSKWVDDRVGMWTWVPVVGGAMSMSYNWEVGNKEMAVFEGVMAAVDAISVANSLRRIATKAAFRTALKTTGKLLSRASKKLDVKALNKAIIGKINDKSIKNFFGKLTLNQIRSEAGIISRQLEVSVGNLKSITFQNARVIARTEGKDMMLMVGKFERPAENLTKQIASQIDNQIKAGVRPLQESERVILNTVEDISEKATVEAEREMAGPGLFDNIKAGQSVDLPSVLNAPPNYVPPARLAGSLQVWEVVVEGITYYAVSMMLKNTVGNVSVVDIPLVSHPKGDTQTDDESEKCKVCAQHGAMICKQYESIVEQATKRLMDRQLAINACEKICANLTKAKAGQVATRLLENAFSSLYIRAFLEDVNESSENTKALENNLNKLDIDLIDSWLLVVKSVGNQRLRTDLARDFEVLSRVKSINMDKIKQRAFKERVQEGTVLADLSYFIGIYKDSRCHTCGNAGYIYTPPLDSIIDNTLHAFATFEGVSKFKEFYKREVMSSKNLNARDGSQHMLRYLRGIVSGRVIAIDMPFGGGSAFPEREFDVRFREGEPVLYIEFKSIDKDSDIEIEQLLSYLSLVNNLTNLRYVFNAKKLNTQQAREMMQKVFNANTTRIFNLLFPRMSADLDLDPTNRNLSFQRFNQMINTLDERLFEFVIIH